MEMKAVCGCVCVCVRRGWAWGKRAKKAYEIEDG